MRIPTQSLLFLAVLCVCAAAQTGHAPYAGQEKREIKSLSPEEIEAYKSGQGMGFAKAAELNQYPGPKHVLELAGELQLSDIQKAETLRIFDRMHRDATGLGERLVAKERELDRLFASKRIDANKLRSTVADIAKLQGQLRVCHLQAHLDMHRLLSPEQIAKYDKLRGYSSDEHPKDHRHNQ